MWQTWHKRTLLGGSLALALTGLIQEGAAARPEAVPPLEPPAVIAAEPVEAKSEPVRPADPR